MSFTSNASLSGIILLILFLKCCVLLLNSDCVLHTPDKKQLFSEYYAPKLSGLTLITFSEVEGLILTLAFVELKRVMD